MTLFKGCIYQSLQHLAYDMNFALKRANFCKKKMAKTMFYVLFFLLIFVGNCRSRSLGYDSNELISNGIDGHVHQSDPYLVLPKEAGYSEEVCEHMYGFLPCSNNLAGHLYQIIVYEYLLFLGERYVTIGSELIFQLLGPGWFGACLFDILGALPESMLVLVSGLSGSKEIAERKLFTGVGSLAGSTVMLLTLLWGTCVIVGKRSLSDVRSLSRHPMRFSSPNDSLYTKFRLYLTGTGVVTDQETSYTARILVLSAVPFIIVQIPEVLHLSSGRRTVTLISLIVSVVLLVVSFFYQLFQPWIQKRRLEYVKLEHLMANFLSHVQRHARGKLLTENGSPNVSVIKRLFDKTDLDYDNCISPAELKDLIKELKSENSDVNLKLEQVLIGEFDVDQDHMISKEEFVNGFVKWIAKSKGIMNSRGSFSKEYLDQLYEEKMVEYAKCKYLLQGILRHSQINAIEKLFTDDGSPNILILKSLFEKFDLDGNNLISLSEFKELINSIKLENMDMIMENAAEELMKKIDRDGDNMINEEEFISGFTKFFDPKQTSDDFYEETWKETDKLVEETSENRGISDSPSWVWFKAVSLLMLGITILSILADPLVEVVYNFSDAVNIPSFFVSFIFLPLATNSRRAVSAIVSARRRKFRTTSLTFSEIYGWVFMNNVLGLIALLALVYIRGLKWDFSAEVLIVLIVCGIIGVLGSFISKFPLWIGLLAYLLYPLSLVLVYVLNSFFLWS